MSVVEILLYFFSLPTLAHNLRCIGKVEKIFSDLFPVRVTRCQAFLKQYIPVSYYYTTTKDLHLLGVLASYVSCIANSLYAHLSCTAFWRLRATVLLRRSDHLCVSYFQRKSFDWVKLIISCGWRNGGGKPLHRAQKWLLHLKRWVCVSWPECFLYWQLVRFWALLWWWANFSGKQLLYLMDNG